MKIIKILFFCVCLMSMTSVAVAATWQVTSAPTNASVAKAAKITNDDGDVLFIWRGKQQDGVQLFAELQLAEGKSFSNKTPGYQIDQGMIVKLDRIPLEPFKSKDGWLRITDKMATWQLFDGVNKPVAKNEPFYQWFTGERVRFIYFDQSGGERTTEFTLSGATRSLVSVAGVESE